MLSQSYGCLRIMLRATSPPIECATMWTGCFGNRALTNLASPSEAVSMSLRQSYAKGSAFQRAL